MWSYNFEIMEREDVNINQKWRKLYFQKESSAKQTGEIHLNFPSIDYCNTIPEYDFLKPTEFAGWFQPFN